MLGNKGICLVRLEKFEEALIFCNKALESTTDKASLWYNRACIYALLNQHEQALSDLKKAISLEEKCREDAQTDPDFESMRKADIKEFFKLVE